MNDQMQQELLKRVDALAAKLGIAANQLWAIFVLQARNESLLEVIFGSLLFVIFGILFGFAIKWTRDDDDAAPLVAIFALVCILAVALGIAPGILGLLNPQYYAFKEIMSALKP